MMSLREVEMCVLDCLQDDDIEDVAALMRMLNAADDNRSWSALRRMLFDEAEVQSALVRLMEMRMVTPAVEQPPDFEAVRPIPREAVGTSIPWSKVWFHLEPEGRKRVQYWWKTEGQAKYPLIGG